MVWCLLQDEIYLDRPYVCGRSLWCVWEGVLDAASQHSALQQQNSGMLSINNTFFALTLFLCFIWQPTLKQRY